jgi:hypothetical protein
MRRISWLVPRLIPVAAIVFGVACNSDSSTSNGGTKSNQAAGSGAAAADVKVKTCANEPTLNIGQPVVTVTNHTSKTSNYLITITVTTADRKTQIDTANAAVNNLEPGQTTDAQAVMGKAIPAGAVCKVAEVTRFAS